MTDEKGIPAARTLYTSNDVAKYTLEEIERRRASHAVVLKTQIERLDKAVLPLMPGEMVVVLANTSQGKSAFLQFWARTVTQQIMERTEQPDQPTDVVLFLTWETLVEEHGLYDLAALTGIPAQRAWRGDLTDEEIESFKHAAFKRACQPLWLMGYSLKRRRQGRFTLALASQALDWAEKEFGIKPACIYADYLQAIDADKPNDDKRIQIIQVTDDLRQLARDCGCAIVVAAQAGQQVLSRDVKLPSWTDGQESSRMAQDSDKLLGLWYPCKTEPMGAPVPGFSQWKVSENLLLVNLIKQRHGASGITFPLYFNPNTNTFKDWEDRNA